VNGDNDGNESDEIGLMDDRSGPASNTWKDGGIVKTVSYDVESSKNSAKGSRDMQEW
jgi:hypothetical protein